MISIPKKVKINGITYKVNVTENIKLGLDFGGEILYGDQEINIRPIGKEMKEVVFFHECIHGMLESLGYDKHDEKLVDGLAHQLFMLINDNPEMLKKG